jgi:hypothetical protein
MWRHEVGWTGWERVKQRIFVDTTVTFHMWSKWGLWPAVSCPTIKYHAIPSKKKGDRKVKVFYRTYIANLHYVKVTRSTKMRGQNMNLMCYSSILNCSAMQLILNCSALQLILNCSALQLILNCSALQLTLNCSALQLTLNCSALHTFRHNVSLLYHCLPVTKNT